MNVTGTVLAKLHEQPNHWLAKPILFLDIDGVLNSRMFAEEEYAAGRLKGTVGIDPEPTKLLQAIIDATDCSLVLSSTWRLMYDLADMRGMLIQAGLNSPVPLRSVTPKLEGIRGLEINKWIELNKPTGRWCCVDDDADFLPGQPLVRTTWQFGMQIEHADRIIKILKGEV